MTHSLKPLLHSLRMAHWSKNLLVFIPLIASHRFGDHRAWLQAVVAWGAFSLLASSGYLLNDLLDRAHDQSHPDKRNRPIAAGQLSALTAGGAAFVSGTLGLVLAALVSNALVVLLVLYLTVTLFYSLWVKKWIVADVVVLAGLFTARIVGGGYAIETAVSNWLLAVSIFFFFGLATLKRVSELARVSEPVRTPSPTFGRGYLPEDRRTLASFGAASGLMSILVFVLYVTGTSASALYTRPDRLWGAAPILLYWLTRLWVLAERGAIPSDPVIYALKDRASYVCLGLLIICFGLAL